MHAKTAPTLAVLLAAMLLGACAGPAASTQPTPAASTPAQGHAMETAAGHGQAAPSRDESAPPPPALNPAQGKEIGFAYGAFLSPHQEGGEEKDTPSLTPNQFKSTAPSLLRSERTGRGHGVVRFTKDLSKAYVDVKIENVKVEDVVMFHIHCGRPGQLGPIIVDFAFEGDLQASLADGVLSATITNEDIEKEAASGEGLVGAFTAGCPIVPGLPDKVKTVAGMQHIAEQGELYFNLHTKGQVFFGDIRGKLSPIPLRR
ncbi:MAG TPA: CHRD domain-containing protein [Roseiflexaceae bacterium]|nr:CHRD domain-containing protein [Roseiflexaceae bacterium]